MKRLKIFRPAWRPKNGELYYYVNLQGEIIFAVYNESELFDLYKFRSGNYFKTKEEAAAAQPKLLKRRFA